MGFITKFNRLDYVWYMENNRLKMDRIHTINISHTETGVYITYYLYGLLDEKSVQENKLFRTQEELLKSL